MGLCSPCTPLDVPLVSSWTPVTVSPMVSPSTRVTLSPTPSSVLTWLAVSSPTTLGDPHLPADVDLQAGVRRVRPLHCPPQVLLSASQLSRKKNNNILDPIATIFIYLSVGFSLFLYSTILRLVD